MNYNQAMDFINSFSKLGKRVNDLSRIRTLLDSLGNPQNKLNFVHIAGTNGKGSTLEYIGDILQNSGLRTGKFTSPFILRYSDRIRVNSDEIDEKSICEICEIITEKIKSQEFSQFEITMAIALIYFLKEKCDIVLLEAGIGGLMDCTNIIAPPLVSVITSISLDHTAILGNTAKEIAVQKAGIIKPRSIVVLSADNNEAVRKIIQYKTNECGCELIHPQKQDITVLRSDLFGNDFIYNSKVYSTYMGGVHQIYNAVTAIEVCNALKSITLKSFGFIIHESVISKSIAQTWVSGRIQFIRGNPNVIVDGLHNISSAMALADILKNFQRKKIFTVLGMMYGKDTQAAEIIAKVSGYVCCADNFAPNCIPAAELEKIISNITTTDSMNFEDAIKRIKNLAAQNNGIAVICGSLYLVSIYTAHQHRMESSAQSFCRHASSS